jgi:hypothetical protein
MAATRKIPADYDGDPTPDSADIEARRKLGAQRERTVPGRLKSNGNTSVGGAKVAGGASLRGGSI